MAFIVQWPYVGVLPWLSASVKGGKIHQLYRSETFVIFFPSIFLSKFLWLINIVQRLPAYFVNFSTLLSLLQCHHTGLSYCFVPTAFLVGLRFHSILT